MYRITFTLCLALALTGITCAQSPADTVKISLPDAESLLVRQNLQLLAAKFNVDASQALRRQAAAWDNPYLLTDQNIYDGKFFRHRYEDGQYYGQVYIQLQQLIRTAGKRHLQMHLAEDAANGSQAAFDDLMRNMHFLLVSDFGDLHRLLQQDSLQDHEAQLLQQLVSGMDRELSLGNISRKENVRVHALLYAIETDRLSTQAAINNLQQELHGLFGQSDSFFIVPILSSPVNWNGRMPSLEEATDSSLARRPDLQLAAMQLAASSHNLQYQRALKYPDLTAAVEYDRSNSYVPRYYGLSLGVPIPVFNRNKGNIQAADYGNRQAQLEWQLKRQSVINEVSAAYKNWMQARSGYQLTSRFSIADYDQLLANMISSYRARNVGLLELIDFFNSYRDSRLSELTLQQTLWQAAANLNFAAAGVVIPFQ